MKSSKEDITRVVRTKREAQAWYDSLSPWYDVLMDPFERRYRSMGIELLDAKQGECIADIGTGTGNALVSLAAAVGDTGRVIGVDIADGMCRTARQKAQVSDVPDRIEIIQGDAFSLPIASKSLDAVFMSFTLELFDTPNLPAVLGECKRVLRDGGRLCVVSLSKRDAGYVTGLYEWLHERMPTYFDCRPIYAEKTLAAEGFETIETRDETMWGLPLEIVLGRV